MSRLEQAAVAIASFLEENRIPYMVIGGFANALRGVPRATLDVDLTVWVSEEEMEQFVGRITQKFPPRTQDPLGFARETGVLPIRTADGIHADVIFGRLPYEKEAIHRARAETIQGVRVCVCSPEDLVLHKITSERTKDRDDVRGIIQQQGNRLDRRYLGPRVAELARELTRPDIQAWYEQCLKEAEGQK